MPDCKYYSNKRYEYHSSHMTWREAYNEGRNMKRKYGCHFFIVPKIEGYMFPIQKYLLYLSKRRR